MKVAGFLFTLIIFWAYCNRLGTDAFRPGVLNDGSFLDASRLAFEAERLIAWLALAQVVTFIALWVALWRCTARPSLANLGVFAAWLAMATGSSDLGAAIIGPMCFAILLAATSNERPTGIDMVIALFAMALWPLLEQPVWIGIVWLGCQAIAHTMVWKSSAWRWWALTVAAVIVVAIVSGGPKNLVDSALFAKNANMIHMPEWRPIDFSKPSGRPLSLLASLGVLFAAQLFARRSLNATKLLPMGLWIAWALAQQRGLDYWWLVGAWLLVDLLRDVRELPALPRPFAWAAIVGVLLAIITTPTSAWIVFGSRRPLDRSLADTVAWRVLGLADLPPGRVLCPPAQGDFLTRILGEDRVVLRSRPQDYDRDFWDDAHRAVQGEPDWWDVLDRLWVNTVILPNDGRFGAVDRLRASKHWMIVFEDAALVVFGRKSPVD